MLATKAASVPGVTAALGMPSGHIPTPTTLVGTQIVNGSDVNRVLKAIEAQKDWGQAK